MGNTAGDIDGDGLAEVIFNNTMSGHLGGIHNYIYTGNKDFKYGINRRIEFPTDGGGPCAVADLDLDGHPEVTFIDSIITKDGLKSGLKIYQGGADGPSPERSEFLVTNDILQGVCVADFNRDGYLDFLITCQAYDETPESLAKSAAIFYGSKDGFSTSRFKPIPAIAIAGSVADVNKDGYLDLVFFDNRGYILIYLGQNDGYCEDRTLKIPCHRLENTGTHGAVNFADLNNDGWLEIIAATMGHYNRLEDTMHIFYGSSNGYNPKNSQYYLGSYSPIQSAIADFNNDGNLDILLTAYSSATARVLPAQLFWGNGKMIDFDNPVNLPAYGSGGALQADLNQDGWIDIFLVNHRNDIGHQVDSLIYWNSPDGFSMDKKTGLPGLGPHGTVSRNFGNAYTREPQESYISPAFDIGDQSVEQIYWKAEVPPPSKLKFQLRSAAAEDGLKQAEWIGPAGKNTYFEKPGQKVKLLNQHRWLQYRAIFVSPYGCRSPKLREVRLK